MSFNMDDSDISWLTQVPSLENTQPVFDLRHAVCDVEDLVGNNCDNIFSLEEYDEPKPVQVLYDNVVCEGISLDEELDNM